MIRDNSFVPSALSGLRKYIIVFNNFEERSKNSNASPNPLPKKAYQL